MKSIDIKIKCPFYREEGHAFIACESINTTYKKLYFVTDTDKQKWLDGVCSVENYKSCSRYQKVMREKYADSN